MKSLIFGLLIALFFIIQFVIIESKIIRGPCPTVQGVDSFDLSQINGQWYQIANSPSRMKKDICASVNITDSNQFTYSAFRNGTETLMEGKVESGEQSAQLQIAFNITLRHFDRQFEVKVNATVIEADYNNYLVLYSCRDIKKGKWHYESYGILSRNKEISEENLNAAINSLENKAQVSNAKSKLQFMRQLYCEYGGGLRRHHRRHEGGDDHDNRDDNNNDD
ncbi:hypothetical protein ABK040_013594 [Willaertia magna]